MDLDDFLKIIEQLAADKDMSKEEIIEKLVSVEQPGMTNVTVSIQTLLELLYFLVEDPCSC